MKFTPIHFGFYEPDFFIERHDHINYFEAIIGPNGQLTYACPSHQQALIRITAMDQETLWRVIQPHENVMIRLMEITNCVPVYTNGYMRLDTITPEQEATLQKLFDKKLVRPVEMTYQW